jgi:hypothetical protein
MIGYQSKPPARKTEGMHTLSCVVWVKWEEAASFCLLYHSNHQNHLSLFLPLFSYHFFSFFHSFLLMVQFRPLPISYIPDNI